MEPYLKLELRLIDSLLPQIGANGFALYMVILRKTRGFKKDWDWLSRSQLFEATGISKRTISRELAKVCSGPEPYILTRKKMHPRRSSGRIVEYCINPAALDRCQNGLHNNNTDSTEAPPQNAENAGKQTSNPLSELEDIEKARAELLADSQERVRERFERNT